MGSKNYRGVYMPDIGEDIHAGTVQMASTLGVITRVASVAAARQIVAANSGSITSANPAYFEINGLIYVHDGSVFKPVNEAEVSYTTYTYDRQAGLGVGEFSGMTKATLGAQPYDRAFNATGMAWGSAKAGNPFLAIRVNGVVESLSRFTSGEAQSVTVVAAGTIPAGSQPEIMLGIYGGSGGDSTLALQKDQRVNRFVVTTTPISMK